VRHKIVYAGASPPGEALPLASPQVIPTRAVKPPTMSVSGRPAYAPFARTAAHTVSSLFIACFHVAYVGSQFVHDGIGVEAAVT
jgi:hypothetical protein